MIRRLTAAFQSDSALIVMSGLTISLSLQVLTSLADRRTRYLADLDKRIALRESQLLEVLAELGNAMSAEQEYPAYGDVDPVGTGEEQADGHVQRPG